jgi:hypothetical protein
VLRKVVPRPPAPVPAAAPAAAGLKVVSGTGTLGGGGQK